MLKGFLIFAAFAISCGIALWVYDLSGGNMVASVTIGTLAMVCDCIGYAEGKYA